MLIPDEAVAELRRLNFPPIFERIWAKEFQFGLCSTCQRPRTFFNVLEGIVARHPRFRNCVPLWEENGERILAYDKASREFISYYYEDKNFTVIGKTYQQFISAFFIGLVYAGLTDDLPYLANLFGYRHLDELRRWAETDDSDSCDESERKFLETITD